MWQAYSRVQEETLLLQRLPPGCPAGCRAPPLPSRGVTLWRVARWLLVEGLTGFQFRGDTYPPGTALLKICSLRNPGIQVGLAGLGEEWAKMTYSCRHCGSPLPVRPGQTEGRCKDCGARWQLPEGENVPPRAVKRAKRSGTGLVKGDLHDHNDVGW